MMRFDSCSEPRISQPEAGGVQDEVSVSVDQCLNPLSVVHDAVIGVDKGDLIQFANDAALRLFGYEMTEIIGSKLAILFQDEAVLAKTRNTHRIRQKRLVQAWRERSSKPKQD